MISRQNATTHQATRRCQARRRFLGSSFAAIATVMLTACGGIPSAQPGAAVPPVAPQVAAQAAIAPTAAPAGAPTAAPIKNPVADASTTGQECPTLTVADIKALTGEDVHPVAPKEFAVGGNTCGNYVNAAGK